MVAGAPRLGASYLHITTTTAVVAREGLQV